MSMPRRVTTESNSPAETIEMGRRLGVKLAPGDVVALIGPLGAGKTELTRGIALGVGAATRVTSPTFKLVNEYAGRIVLYHVDAYRLAGSDDLVALGSDEWFDGDGAAVVEWADRVAAALPADHLRVEINVTGITCRSLVFNAAGARAERLMPRPDQAAPAD